MILNSYALCLVFQYYDILMLKWLNIPFGCTFYGCLTHSPR